LVGLLAFVRTILNHISRVLFKHNVKMTGFPPRKSLTFFSVKDDLALKMPGVHSTPCEYRMV
jgi:hypothetical protein